MRLLILLFCLSAFPVIAQTFQPDPYGFVHDPQFKKLIADRGYKLVGAFTPVDKEKKIIVARVLKGNQEIYIDLTGKEYTDKNEMRVLSGREPFFPASDRYAKDDETFSEGIAVPAGKNEEYANVDDDFRKRKLFTVNGKKGMIYDKDTVFRAVYDKIQPTRYPEGLFYQLEKDNKRGVADAKGKMLVPVMYDEVSRFHQVSKRLAYLVKQGTKYGILSEKGTVTIPIEYPRLRWDKGQSYIEMSDHVKGKRYVGALDTNGRLIIPMIYNSFRQPEGAAFVFVTKGKYSEQLIGAIDFSGRMILDTMYSDFDYFNKDMYELTIGDEDSKNARSGLYDIRKQQFILPCEYSIEDDYGTIRISKQIDTVRYYGLIDRNGKLLREVKYTWLEYLPEEKLLILQEKGKTGVVDSTGKILIPSTYEALSYVRLNERPESPLNKTIYFVFKQNGKYGLLDGKNKVLIQANYGELHAGPFGVFYRNGDTCGVLDYTGKMLFAEQNAPIAEYRDGVITTRNAERRRVLIDFYGNTFVR